MADLSCHRQRRCYKQVTHRLQLISEPVSTSRPLRDVVRSLLVKKHPVSLGAQRNRGITGDRGSGYLHVSGQTRTIPKSRAVLTHLDRGLGAGMPGVAIML